MILPCARLIPVSSRPNLRYLIAMNDSDNIDEDGFDADGAALENIESGLPLISFARDFGRALDQLPWFSRLGERLTRDDRDSAVAWVEGLGFPYAHASLVTDFEDAAAIAEALAYDTPGFDAEEQFRATLTTELIELVGEDPVQLAQTLITEGAGQATKDCAAEAAAMWDEVDQELLNAMSGAAIQAAHGEGLRRMLEITHDHLNIPADHDLAAHPFRARFSLFGRGRWIIGLTGETLSIF